MLHLVLIAVNQPATSLIFFGVLLNLLNFQLIDLTNFYNKLFRLDPDSEGNSPFNSQFELMGYGSLFIVQNFGLLCITLFSPFLTNLITSVLVFMFKGKRNIFRLDYQSLREK